VVIVYLITSLTATLRLDFNTPLPSGSNSVLYTEFHTVIVFGRVWCYVDVLESWKRRPIRSKYVDCKDQSWYDSASGKEICNRKRQRVLRSVVSMWNLKNAVRIKNEMQALR
jgi:hypothetical protein